MNNFRGRFGESRIEGVDLETGDRHIVVERATFGRYASGYLLFMRDDTLYASELGSVIEAVNQVGSYFYGSLLGAFVLAVAVPFANGHGAFVGLIAGVLVVWSNATFSPDLSFLYLNTIGTLAVVAIGVEISLLTRNRSGSPPPPARRDLAIPLEYDDE